MGEGSDRESASGSNGGGRLIKIKNPFELHYTRVGDNLVGTSVCIVCIACFQRTGGAMI